MYFLENSVLSKQLSNYGIRNAVTGYSPQMFLKTVLDFSNNNIGIIILTPCNKWKNILSAVCGSGPI